MVVTVIPEAEVFPVKTGDRTGVVVLVEVDGEATPKLTNSVREKVSRADSNT